MGLLIYTAAMRLKWAKAAALGKLVNKSPLTPDEYRTRFFKAVTLSMAGASVFSTSLVYWAAGPLALGPATFIVCSLALYLFVVKTQRIELASHLLMAVLLGVITGVMLFSGGTYSLASPGVFLVPLMACFLLGRRAGILWSVVGVALLFMFMLFDQNGYSLQLPNLIPPASRNLVFGSVRALIFVTATAIAYVFDLTRQRAEASITDYSSYLQSILESISEILVVFDASGTIIMTNSAAERMIGDKESNIVGKNVGEFIFIEDVPFAYAKVVNGETVDDKKGVLRTSRQQEISILIISSQLSSISAKGSGGVLVARDLSALENLESRLLQSQKLATIGKMAGGIAHHFNNLLTGILGAAALIKNQAQEAETKALAEAIVESSIRAAALTAQILAFGRQQILRPEQVDVDKAISDMSEIIKQIAGEQISVQIHANSGANIIVDKPRLAQVIMNLVNNACDAMPNGGLLTIETSEHSDEISGTQVMIAISDTGVGMDKEMLGRVFEPFNTTKEVGRGAGLGLATAYGIVKQSGGNIWAYSEPKKGTTFKIYFPQAKVEFESATNTKKANMLSGSETILVTEDEPVVRIMVSKILSLNGYHVIEADQGSDAIQKANQHTGSIHLLLTDVVMPSMNGQELAGHLTAKIPNLVVLYMSGYTEQAIVRQGVLDAGLDFLQKPFSPEQLLQAVRKVLDARVGQR